VRLVPDQGDDSDRGAPADRDQRSQRDRDGIRHDLDWSVPCPIERNHEARHERGGLLGSQLSVAGVDDNVIALPRRGNVGRIRAERVDFLFREQTGHWFFLLALAVGFLARRVAAARGADDRPHEGDVTAVPNVFDRRDPWLRIAPCPGSLASARTGAWHRLFPPVRFHSVDARGSRLVGFLWGQKATPVPRQCADSRKQVSHLDYNGLWRLAEAVISWRGIGTRGENLSEMRDTVQNEAGGFRNPSRPDSPDYRTLAEARAAARPRPAGVEVREEPRMKTLSAEGQEISIASP